MKSHILMSGQLITSCYHAPVNVTTTIPTYWHSKRVSIRLYLQLSLSIGLYCGENHRRKLLKLQEALDTFFRR
jgi:hypothetical protein